MTCNCNKLNPARDLESALDELELPELEFQDEYGAFNSEFLETEIFEDEWEQERDQSFSFRPVRYAQEELRPPQPCSRLQIELGSSISEPIKESLARIWGALSLKAVGGYVRGSSARDQLEKAFCRVPLAYASQIHGQLARREGSLGKLFHYRLAPPTEMAMLGTLRNKAENWAVGAPVPPDLRTVVRDLVARRAPLPATLQLEFQKSPHAS